MKTRKIILLFAFFIIGSFLCESCNKKDDENDNSTRTIPTVTTLHVSDITNHTAIVRGVTTDDGGAFILGQGICYSTSPNPLMPCTSNEMPFHVLDEPWEVTLDNLDAHTKYYIKAFALNSEGYGYGVQKTFTTQ